MNIKYQSFKKLHEYGLRVVEKGNGERRKAKTIKIKAKIFKS